MLKSLILLSLVSALFCKEIPSEEAKAHKKCIDDRLVFYGKSIDTIDSYAIVAAARYCDDKIREM